MSKEFYISKTEGKAANFKKFKEHWDSLPDGRYKLTIASNKKRSLQQNAWFHSVLPDILNGLREVGYNDIRTTEDAKDFVKSIFFRKKISNGFDVVEVIEGTSEQSKLNFAEKAEDIIIWANSYLGIDIAPPSEQLEMSYK
jgi:hypothetical protein